MTRATDIEQQASEWIIRSESGHFTAGMQVELARWLEDPRNRVTYLRIREAWRRAGRIRSARPLDGNVDPDLLKSPDPASAPDSNIGSRRRVLIAAAAALCLVIYVIGIGAWFALSRTEWISYTTSIGGYSHVTLADGSGIQLNTDSEIRARLTQHKRELWLIRGEALIKVTPDARRPFTVSAANTLVRANPPVDSRAAFVVRLRTPKDVAKGIGVDIAVTEGNVMLGPADGIIDVALGRSSAAESILAAGDTAAVRPDGVHLENVGSEEVNRKLSWTEGLLYFKGETLAEVTDEFNRYNRKHLIVTDTFIAQRRIGGAFKPTDPESFVSALQKWFGVHADEQLYTPSNNEVIRLTAAR
jgi:transmembrane sensor